MLDIILATNKPFDNDMVNKDELYSRNAVNNGESIEILIAYFSLHKKG